MIFNIHAPIVNAYVCATVIFGGLILLFGLLWCLLFIGCQAIFEFSAHCKFWRNLVEAAFGRMRAKSKKRHSPKE